MSFAPNGRFLACFTESLILTVISTSFEIKVLDFDTADGASSPPRDMKWCGEDSIVLHWKNLGVLMVGPKGEWLRFPYENTANLHIIPEIDCCRVVTDTEVEILQRVPPSTALLLRIGSIEPSALLLDASDAFESGSPAADEAARAITKTGQLDDAIVTCSEAAMKEFDISTQKRLLRAASYGMHFAYKDNNDGRNILGGVVELDLTDPSIIPPNVRPSPTALLFLHAAKKIRIMNALRQPHVGIPLTSAQYDAVTPQGIIARLVEMKRPSLANAIATYLDLSPTIRSLARTAQAMAFVSSAMEYSETQTAEMAVNMLRKDAESFENRGEYARLAFSAYEAGREGVAEMILKYEEDVCEKVPVLIAIKKFADAAIVAASAIDTNSMFQTLTALEKECQDTISDPNKAQQQFTSKVVTKFPPDVINLLKSYYTSMTDISPMMSTTLKEPNYAEAGAFVAKRGMTAPTQKEKLSYVKEASRVFSLHKDTAFQKIVTDDYLELITEQARLRQIFPDFDPPPTSSITQTLYLFIYHASFIPRDAHRVFGEADKFAKKFRIPDKRLWHVKVSALSKSGQWGHLKNLADSRTKPPIGFKPFAKAAMKGGCSQAEVAGYIGRVVNAEEKFELYVEGSYWQKALEEAVRLKDQGKVIQVREMSVSEDTKRLCDEYLKRL